MRNITEFADSRMAITRVRNRLCICWSYMSLRRKRLHHHWGLERIIVLENGMECTYTHVAHAAGRAACEIR